MKRLRHLLALAALAALGWWLWTVLFPGPEKIIRQRLAELARTATFDERDSVIVRLGRAKRMPGFFTRDAELFFETMGYRPRHYSGRDEIGEAAQAGFVALRGLGVTFLDVTVQVAGDRQTAELTCTVQVRFPESRDLGVQEMRLRWRKVDGHWLISRAESVKTLS